MCGVTAAVGEESGRLVREALTRMMHRGIRSSVVDLPGGCSMGHVRLPIVGVGEENDQPVREGRWTLAFVGEVLDFRSYTSDSCDVGLVARTWASEGPGGFRSFDGFWSVVAWDGEELHAMVDYLSQKPLYVREDVGLVASEPAVAASVAPVTIDPIYLSAVVKWGYCPETWRTPYREVRRMRPGEHVVLRIGGRASWRVVDELAGVQSSSPEQDLRGSVEEAVRLRIQSSDVPVACLLSGGLDSSIVRLLAGRYGDVRSYHVENGELDRCLRVDPAAQVVGEIEWDPTTSEQLDWMQEPIDLGSLVPQMKLSRTVANLGGERVCLTGDGADEFLGGYGRAERYDSQASDVWHELVAWHLPKLDRIMMRNRIEVRSPFLARRVAGLCLGLPRDLRIRKSILRSAFRGSIPEDILERPKVPLRTESVGGDREGRSITLVKEFVKCRR